MLKYVRAHERYKPLKILVTRHDKSYYRGIAIIFYEYRIKRLDLVSIILVK